MLVPTAPPSHWPKGENDRQEISPRESVILFFTVYVRSLVSACCGFIVLGGTKR